MPAHQALRYRGERLAFFFCEGIKTEQGARVDQRVVAHHVLDALLHPGGQGIPGRTHVGKLGFATLWRNHAGMQHRILCWR